jgi:hypothetical protein
MGLKQEYNEMVSKLFRREISVFQARQGRRAKRLEAQLNFGESLFAKPEEVTAEKMRLSRLYRGSSMAMPSGQQK